MSQCKWVALLICFKASFVHAQQDSVSLDPVSVTASFVPTKVSTTGRNIVVIMSNQLKNLPIHSIDELLRYVPGIEVQARGPMGSQSDIVIRGGTFQQVLLVLDGIRLNDPNTGHFNSYIPIATSEIDRIEILKGAASAVYGSEAVGGVIHIISKTFAGKKETNSFNLQATGGQYGLWTVNAGAAATIGKTQIAGGILSNNANGQQQRGTTGFFNNNTVSVSARHQFSDGWHLSLRSAYDKRNFSAQNFYTTFKSDTAKEIVESYWNQVNLTYQHKRNKLSFDAGYKKASDEYAFNTASLPNKNISTLLQASIRHDYQFSETANLVSGVQLQDKRIRSNDRGDHQLNQFAGFVILNQQFAKRWYAAPALRIDYMQNSGTELVPQLNLSYKLNALQLRSSIGKTVRQADFTERFNNYNKALVTGGSIGNPNLEAERSLSYELGADIWLKKDFKLSVGLFQREQTKLIDWTPTAYADMPRRENLSPTGNYALARNIASVNTAGFETDIQYHHIWGESNKIWATTGLLWLSSKSTDNIPSFYISSHAKFLGNASFVYSNKLGSLGINGLYKLRKTQSANAIDATISKDYFVMNAKLEGSIIKNQFSVFLQADNVFDRNYSDLLGSQMPGRWLMGGLKVRWN